MVFHGLAAATMLCAAVLDVNQIQLTPDLSKTVAAAARADANFQSRTMHQGWVLYQIDLSCTPGRAATCHHRESGGAGARHRIGTFDAKTSQALTTVLGKQTKARITCQVPEGTGESKDRATCSID